MENQSEEKIKEIVSQYIDAEYREYVIQQLKELPAIIKEYRAGNIDKEEYDNLCRIKIKNFKIETERLVTLNKFDMQNVINSIAKIYPLLPPTEPFPDPDPPVARGTRQIHRPRQRGPSHQRH